MECYEKGLLIKDDLGGIEASFGSGEALVKLAEMIVTRKGLGGLMAEGTARFAKKLGPTSEAFAVHVKGKEFPAHMPTAKSVMGLIYAVNPFGPDHVSTEHDPALNPPGEILKGFGIYDPSSDPGELNFEKTRLLAYSQRFVSAIDSFSVCQFCFNTWTMYTFEEFLDVINAATGWHYTLAEFMLLGERRVNMMKAFNMREGFDAKDDMLPRRLFEDGLTDNGPGSGRTVNKEDFLACRRDYYVLNGWDPDTGNPSEVKLKELGLGWTSTAPSSSPPSGTPR